MEQNKQAKQGKINFFKEKQWIMAWWFKSQRSIPTEIQLMLQWQRWWKGDFPNIKDERFQKTYEWVKNTVQTLTMEQIKQKRYEASYGRTKPVARGMQEEANKKGYFVKKSSVTRKPLSVTGYAIFKKNGKKISKESIYGEKYDLTAKQVNEFLETKEDKKNNGAK